MDLYKTLRISIYLLVASAAFAVVLVEGQLIWLLCVLCAGIASHLTVDSGRFPPVRTPLALALGLALLVYFSAPSLAGLHRNAQLEVAQELTHFLLIVQCVLFFTGFRTTTLFSFCAASLFVVVFSGIVDNGPSLLLRLILFLGAVTWTLFIHTLWRERSRFEQKLAAPTGPRIPANRSGRLSVERSESEQSRTLLSEKTILQGLKLTGFVTLTSLLFGFVLFFSWPRITRNLVELIPFGPDKTEELGHGGSVTPTGHSSRSGERQIGPTDSVSLENMGPLRDNPAPALEVILSKVDSNPEAVPQEILLGEVADENGRIYLRSKAFDLFERNVWKVSTATITRNARLNYIDFDEQAHHHLRYGSQGLIRQTVTLRSNLPGLYFALAPVRRLKQLSVEVDEEGNLMRPRERLLTMDYRYEVHSEYPVRISEIPVDAQVYSPHLRYLGWASELEAQIENLARRITANAQSDLARVVALRDYLRNHYSYTRFLEGSIPRDADHIADFLLHPDPRHRKGHCGFFASAFVVLCRSLQIPSRLAVGFSHQGQARSSWMLVRQHQAHAWGEVFFKGFGWVCFDPTPVNEELQEEPSVAERTQDPQFEAKEAKAKELDAAFNRTNRNWLTQSWQYFLNYSHEEQDRVYGVAGGAVQSFFDRLGNWMSGRGTLGKIGAGLLWLLVLGGLTAIGLVLWTTKRQRSRTRMPLTPRAQAAVNFYSELLTALSRRGFVRREGQTPREFAILVMRRGGQSFAPMLLVTQVFERVRYGGSEIDEEELTSLKLSLERIMEQLAG